MDDESTVGTGSNVPASEAVPGSNVIETVEASSSTPSAIPDISGEVTPNGSSPESVSEVPSNTEADPLESYGSGASSRIHQLLDKNKQLHAQIDALSRGAEPIVPTAEVQAPVINDAGALHPDLKGLEYDSDREQVKLGNMWVEPADALNYIAAQKLSSFQQAQVTNQQDALKQQQTAAFTDAYHADLSAVADIIAPGFEDKESITQFLDFSIANELKSAGVEFDINNLGEMEPRIAAARKSAAVKMRKMMGFFGNKQIEQNVKATATAVLDSSGVMTTGEGDFYRMTPAEQRIYIKKKEDAQLAAAGITFDGD